MATENNENSVTTQTEAPKPVNDLSDLYYNVVQNSFRGEGFASNVVEMCRNITQMMFTAATLKEPLRSETSDSTKKSEEMSKKEQKKEAKKREKRMKNSVLFSNLNFRNLEGDLFSPQAIDGTN
jgi:hypothetical protein